MTKKEALKILIAQGYCNAGKELKCEDCICYDADLIEDFICCPTIAQTATAVKVIEQMYGEI